MAQSIEAGPTYSPRQELGPPRSTLPWPTCELHGPSTHALWSRACLQPAEDASSVSARTPNPLPAPSPSGLSTPGTHPLGSSLPYLSGTVETAWLWSQRHLGSNSCSDYHSSSLPLICKRREPHQPPWLVMSLRTEPCPGWLSGRGLGQSLLPLVVPG